MLKRALISLLGIGVLFILLGRVLGLSEGRLEKATSVVMYPFLKVQQGIVRPLKRWAYTRRIKNNLLAEYTQLVRQRDELLKEVILLKGHAHERTRSEELRTYSKRFGTQAVIAPVLLNSSSFMLLDAGTTSGIKEGMIAVYNNCLVGKVTESYPLYSKVVRITDPSCKVAVYCASNGVKGIHSGQVKGPITLEYVDHRDTVTEGELLLSSGKGGVFPRGFCVGTIAQVDSTPYGRSIVITPCLAREPEYVCVIPHTLNLERLVS